MKENGPTRARSCPSRPRRKRKRIVAPRPPARKKPAPSAPAATTGSRSRILPATSVASPSPARRSSTASASCSRSAAMSRRTSSAVRELRAIAPQGLRRQLCLPQGLLRHRRRAPLDLAQADKQEDERHQEQASEDD